MKLTCPYGVADFITEVEKFNRYLLASEVLDKERFLSSGTQLVSNYKIRFGPTRPTCIGALAIKAILMEVKFYKAPWTR